MVIGPFMTRSTCPIMKAFPEGVWICICTSPVAADVMKQRVKFADEAEHDPEVTVVTGLLPSVLLVET